MDADYWMTQMKKLFALNHLRNQRNPYNQRFRHLIAD
jgi:hypothetical protein